MKLPHRTFLTSLPFLVVLLQLCSSRIFFKRPKDYNTFMRQSTVNYEKAKVETLGDIFKRHVQKLRQTPNKQVELVFLIDSSGTVGRYYFYEEIRFVRNLLADFTVDVNSTRVSVITFSSPHKIFRHIDYLSQPDNGNHKCRLLNEDIPHVDYTPGGTHTLGALLEAEKVLRSARPHAAKAIFLMTDGYSNGGDPRPVAHKLKRQGVKIFTFGIRDGFVWELQDMASEPKNETCYILDSFEEFEALAKRALHADLQSGVYVEQTAGKCNKLCSNDGLCCHKNATCSCGTYTGRYECLCKPGYYGTGRGKVGCKPCPPGTYKNFTGLGDINVCTPCPDEHQTTPPSAVSPQQCVCKRGYRSFGSKECTVFRCPELSPPKYGYFVNNKCHNVYNAACGLRCQHGYELRGSSLRICQDDGNWSGQDAECIMKTCPSLPPPKNGHMICTSDDFSYASVCRFTCNAGYQLVGSRKRTCLAIAFWTGIATRCREITCPPLVEIKDGTITPLSCTAREVIFGSICQISCLSGYTLKGPHTKQCTPDGTWMTPEKGVNQCVDEAPPVLRCPKNIEVIAEEFEDMKKVSWTVPVPVDNSGFRPVLTSEPAVTPGSEFPIGITFITYKAEDLSQNVAKCKFYVQVIDKTPPRIDKCISPPPFVSKQETANVILEPPIFSDNSGKPVEVAPSHRPGESFPLGTTTVKYKAFDSSNNNSTCTIEVVVLPHLCVTPKPPVNGNASCTEGEVGVLCQVTCNEGHAFAIQPAEEYFCAYEDGRWMPEENYPFPDCAVSQISNDILQPATITLTGDLSCKDMYSLHRVEQDFEGRVKEKLTSACENDLSCSVGTLKSVCEDEEDFNKIQLVPDKKRRKRSLLEYSEMSRVKRASANKKSRISFDLMLEGSLKTRPSATDVPDMSESLMKMLTSLQREARRGNFDMRVAGRTLKFSQMSFDLDLKMYRCPEGSVLINETCVNCPVGTFFHVVTERCQDCPKGTYQPFEGHNTCLRCPDNMSTEKEHAKNIKECKALCLPGTSSPIGLEPCETCHLGFYQSDYSARFCYPCSGGRTTHRRGSRTDSECAEICSPGHASQTGLSPCFPCPRNSYQPKHGQMECFKCPAGGTSAYPATESVEDCILPLESMEIQSDDFGRKGGSQARVAANICFAEPCQNGGTCSIVKGSQLFTCTCAKGFTGMTCEDVLDMCEAKPCHNGGSCESIPGGFVCFCKDGFTGTNCEGNIDECTSSPCENKGTCVDGINSFTCNCPIGYGGPTCSNPVNDCTEASCQNGGTCTNTATSFKCLCTVGYTGETCEIDVDECMKSPCQNGGSCQDLPGKYKCDCKRGYTGRNCESEINECAENPCQNGATCEDLMDNYKCHCLGGYSGKKCEKSLTSQYQLDFTSPSIMDYAELTIDEPLTSVTVSFWIRTTDSVNQGTPFSYAVRGEDNAFTVTDYQNLNLVVNGELKNIGISLNDGKWHHVVLTWSSYRGDWKAYVDGILRDQGYNLSTAKPIPGKGSFIIGQEQDSLGGGFSPSETFVGSLTHLNVWQEELSLSDIEKLRFKCDSFLGNVISWPDAQEALKGDVGSSPSSFCENCPTPTDPLFGSVDFTSTKPGSEANYECNVGYSMAGNPSLRCLISGQWEDLPPPCLPINCGHPGSIRYGYMVGRDFSYDKRIRFQCNRGYELEGPSTLYCTEWGDWDDVKPKCVEIQCDLPEVSVNTVPSSSANKFKAGTRVDFTCKPGSRMQTQHDSVLCQRDGSWDKSVPTCDDQKCNYPPAIEFGEPFTANPENNVGEIVRYQCNFGYEFNPDASNVKNSIACLPSGEWETELPVCGPIRCSDPPRVPKAIANGEGRVFGSKVNYTCLPGFRPRGNSVIQCEETRDWSSMSFRCLPVDCGDPTPLEFGSIDGQLSRYNAVITYQCNQGYQQKGPQTRRCQENGTWSGAEPSCKPVTCGDLETVDNGNVIYKDTTYLSTAQFSCNPGYELKGFADIVCEASGLWAPDPPSCEPRVCPVPEDIDFGTYEASGRFVYGESIEYNCFTGYKLTGEGTLSCQEDGTWSAPTPACESIMCPELEDPEHGSVFVAGRTYSKIAGYTCDGSFRMDGVDSRTCQADGTWSAEAPKCIATKCIAPDMLSNGAVEFKDLSIGSIVRYYCDKGYNLEGDTIRRCQNDLTYSGTRPVCKPVDCGNVGVFQNGIITLSDNKTTFGSVATFSCNEGHNLFGDTKRVCETNGKWSNKIPECIPVQCPKIQKDIPYGQANTTNANFGSVVGYECDFGYTTFDSPVRRCQATGKWDNKVPKCEIIYCPHPKFSNGWVSSFNRNYGDVVKFTCKRNYRLDGPSERTCLITAEWSGEQPYCLKINCKAPERVANSKSEVLNATAIEYECDPGFYMVGQRLRVCGIDDIWRPEPPRCQIITCKDLSQSTIENGEILYSSNKFGDSVKYSCDPGYTLNGMKERKCLPLGWWEGSEPRCRIVSCGHPGILSNGKVLGKEYTFNSSVEFECNTGYRLIGTDRIRCQRDGSWEKTLPSCERIMCPDLNTTIPNGQAIIFGQTVFSTAEYECEAGFSLLGKNIRECLETGEWSDKEPSCVDVFCPPPAPINHAIMEGDEFDFGAKISYKCEEGYYLHGPVVRACQEDGTWSKEAPECVPVNCPEPTWMEYGRFIGESGFYKSVIRFECEEGYKLIGSEERTCLSNATWSGEDPDCIKISCGTPPPITNAVIDQSQGFLFQANVVYSCIEGYSASGQDTSTCQSNKQWSIIDFACTIVSCPSFSIADIPHAIFEESNFTFGSIVSFSCEEGYLLSGSSEITCTSKGTWSEEFPKCLIVQCPKLPSLEHGTVLSTSSDFGSIATFSCNTGYELAGDQTTKCLSVGEWNSSQPTCSIISCKQPPLQIDNGKLRNPQPEYFYQDTCSYACDSGYEIKGNNLLTCLETGKFDLPPPKCERIPCPYPEKVEYGTFTTFNNHTVNYECQNGYELTGRATLECLLGGIWSGLAPKCKPVVCPKPSPFANGFIEENGYIFGRSISYFCDPGFELEGQDTRFCQADQTWSNAEPVCVPISCEEPSGTFENGFTVGQYIFGEGVEYYCDDGFELSGDSFRLCQEDGSLEGEVPECLRLSCSTPFLIDNGIITGNSYMFEDNITYSCSEGYQLQGTAVRTCLASLEWSGLPPLCVRVSCGTPGEFDHGYYKGISYLYEDEVNVTCNSGYRLTTEEYRVCQANAQWSGILPVCQPVFCPNPPIIGNSQNNATIGLDSHPYSSVIVYECDRGHEMDGNGKKVCQQSGQWSDSVIECSPVVCPAVHSVEHGTVTGESFDYLSELEFSCEDGFELIGNSTLRCGEFGEWQSSIPYCVIVDCPFLYIENGYMFMYPKDASKINASREDRLHVYGDILTIECDLGHVASGGLESECLIDGTWSNTNMTCVPVKCSKPIIENAILSDSPLIYGSSITVSCIDGYDLIGESELKCGSDKKWEESLPQCVLLACGSPPSVANTIIVGDSFEQGSTINYKCKRGYELVGNSILTCGPLNEWVGSLPFCTEIDCGPPPVFPASTVTVGKTTFRSAAEVKCNSGYVQQGNATIVCTANQSWNYDPKLECAPIDCGDPPSIMHGSFSVGNTTLQNTAVYTCDKGYFMMEASSLFCDEDGSWVYELPKCSPVDCLDPPKVEHAAYSTNGTLYLSVADYSCDDGYAFENASVSSLLCGYMRLWLGDMPSCQAIDCGTPPEISHAYYLLDNNRTDYLSYAIYHCQPGYEESNDESYLTCNASGHWEGTEISCQPVDCSDRPVLKNGHYQMDNGTEFGSVVHYTCDEGYEKSGPGFIHCTDTGTWSTDSHACLAIDCRVPPIIDKGGVEFGNTIYKSKALYNCLPGYRMVGNESSECLGNGSWSSTGPTCSPVDCKTPPSVHHGEVIYTSTTFQSLALYACSDGYTIADSNSLTCGKEATWIGQVPYCLIVNCSEPEVSPHSKVVFSSLTYKSVALYSCESGYQLLGQSSPSCTENGTWSSEPPECVPLDCSSPIKIKNGKVIASGTTFGATASYECDNGYKLIGVSTVYCGEDGAWNTSAPTCKIIDCKAPAKIDRGIVLFGSTTFSSVATYQCNKGYQLAGNEKVTCKETGEWYGDQKPRCELVNCYEPPDVIFATVKYGDTTYGSQAVYSCDSGHTMTGPRSITCGEDRSWKGQLPVCDPIKCPRPSDIPNGYLIIQSLQIGSVAEYSCHTGYVIEGEGSPICMPDGSWLSEFPRCVRVRCGPPPTIANAILISNSGTLVGSEVHYTCRRGYRMVNDVDNEIAITCGNDGDWNGKIPSCEIVVCYSQPPTIPNSRHTVTGDTFKSTATYTCNPGYKMAGKPVMECDHHGQWSGILPPTCLPVPCGPPPPFPKASIEGTDFTYSQSVEYVCDPGHDLIGYATSICQINSTWSPVDFLCKPRECSLVAEPEKGEIVGGTGGGPYFVGASIAFECHGEYTLIGPTSIWCDESGQWNESPPECHYIIDLCSETLFMDNIKPPPPGKVTGDVITVQCDTGYLANGDMTSVCQSDSSWTLPQGRCDKVFCGKPEVKEPQNVMVMGRNFYYKDSVTFMCRYGFQPVHSPPILTCQSNGQWDGTPDCVAHCKERCLNGGLCLGFNRCKCMPGWAGRRCETAVCILPCLHGGRCVAPYKCECAGGYKGSRCQHAVCAKPCENGGRCLWPNKCQCLSGFQGAFCETMSIGHKKMLNLT